MENKPKNNNPFANLKLEQRSKNPFHKPQNNKVNNNNVKNTTVIRRSGRGG